MQSTSSLRNPSSGIDTCVVTKAALYLLIMEIIMHHSDPYACLSVSLAMKFRP